MNKYINPFGYHGLGKLDPTKTHYYVNNAPRVAEYKGYQVFAVRHEHYDIVYGGVCITQRCGWSRELIDRGDDMYTEAKRCAMNDTIGKSYRLDSYYKRLAEWRLKYPNKALQLDLWRQYRALRVKPKKDRSR